jgi:hypothetical protein
MTDGRDGYELAPAWLSSKNLQSVSILYFSTLKYEELLHFKYFELNFFYHFVINLSFCH